MEPSRAFAFSVLTLTSAICCLIFFNFNPATSSAETNNTETNNTEKTMPSVESIDFSTQISPIFAKHCYACHGPDKQEGTLRLDQKKSVFSKLESGERAIVPKRLDHSELYRRIVSKDVDTQMPPEGKRLSQKETALIKRWIEQGATWKNHWSFEPPTQPTPPKKLASQWGQNPIDAFVLKRLESKGLAPARRAEKSKLIRRLYFDLTGLPPSPEAVEAFVHSKSNHAYEEMVDRLLASPRYGEKWGRHWLDLVRYGDTASFEYDHDKRFAWRYRDYVIRSLNDNKPYDQFIREQLAGDEFKKTTEDSMIATGYYRLAPWDLSPADRKLAYYEGLDDIVTTTGKAFLGLTINCARCHDHKIDPIPQKDYYKFLAFFHDLQPFGWEGKIDEFKYNQVDISSPEIVKQYQNHEKKLESLHGKLTKIEQEGIVKMSSTDQRASEMKGKRAKLLKKKLKKHLSAKRYKQYQSLQLERGKLKKKRLPSRNIILGLTFFDQPKPTHVLLRGSPETPGEKVSPAFPELFQAELPKLPARSASGKSSGRRLVLANWIASPKNIFTRRVIVNRIWQHHFGRGIVRSSNNFGRLGRPPTHPLLLDWLAEKFLKENWDIKKMHKLILMSSTYQMSTRSHEKGMQVDPENNLFWRFPMRRLSAEEIRDSILAVNGTLNLKMYGRGIYPTISKEVMQGQSRPGKGWKKSSPKEQARRSIYIHVKRSLIVPVLETFDFADTDGTCPERFTTVQPAQALAMINSPFLNQQADLFAKRLEKEKLKTEKEKVRRAIELAFSRPANKAEIERGLSLLKTLKQKHQLHSKSAMKYYCLTLFNQNEFLTVD